MATKADIPSQLESGMLQVDPNANIFRKDPQNPTSLVIVTTSFVQKSDYIDEQTPIGEAHPTQNTFYAYEETVSDVGGGFFEVKTRYAQVPDTWYSFESINIPYVKFLGLSTISAGAIVINTTYLYNFLNVPSIADVKFFNEDGFTSVEEKTGTINVACRVKHEYALATLETLKSGDIASTVIDFSVSTAANVFGDGPLNCGYIMRNGDPQSNMSIDSESTFTFTNINPSSKVRIASGIYVGIIYYKNTYEIVRDVKI